ncbi:DNA-directed RNA polymerase subunit delta [[Mycoplasma] collis]|uniref:DNA-directed RNA polymerase subunit delta n=1 Tax=[Mycoplasma] collis TaxID=2127 RepID=UPI00051B6219|nr:hypothetical protein [[Mycoplasma] collis]
MKKNHKIKDLAIEVLSQNDTLTFYEVFEYVKNALFSSWIEKNKSLNAVDKQILIEKKMGELYKILTVDRFFIKNSDESWSLNKHASK